MNVADQSDVIAALRLSRELDARAQELRRRAACAMLVMDAQNIARIAKESGYATETLLMLVSRHRPR